MDHDIQRLFVGKMLRPSPTALTNIRSYQQQEGKFTSDLMAHAGIMTTRMLAGLEI
jgi:hypothetical protein